MKKMKIVSVACAALIAAQMMATGVSAATTDNYYYYNGVYYSDFSDAYYEATLRGDSAGWDVVSGSQIPSSASVRYYSAITRKLYTSESAALADNAPVTSTVYVGSAPGSSSVISSSGTYSSTYCWYSTYTNRYYASQSDAIKASNNSSSYVRYAGSSATYYYYSSVTGLRYSTYSAALAASGYDSSKVSSVPYYYYYGYETGSIYRYYYNGTYYASVADAQKAGGTSLGTDIFYVPNGEPAPTTYYYHYQGKYYGSLQEAINAGGTSLGTDITYVPYNYYNNPSYYYYNGTSNPYYYYNGYYYGGYYNINDPYYVYNKLFNNSSFSSSSEKTAKDGEPYIYGKKTKAGWDTIVKYVNAASSGATITVDMNGCNIVDEDVLSALDGKNVSVTFVLDNGVKWTINGKKVSTPKDITVYTEYNIKYIPTSLVKKATKGAVGQAQIGVSTNFDSLGSKASVTVKFSTKRAGCTAVAYRYDPDSNSLKGVSKSKVQSNGNCTFSVEAGGPYLIVLK